MKQIRQACDRLSDQNIYWVDDKNFPVQKGEKVYLECEFVGIRRGGEVMSLKTKEGQPITIRGNFWHLLYTEED